MQKGVCLEKKVKCSEVRHSVQIQVVLVISDISEGGLFMRENGMSVF